MPDFSHEAGHKFWKNYQDKLIYRVVAFMEGVEDWTVDGDASLEESLKKLETALDNVDNIDLQQEDNMIEAISFLKMGRLLNILMSMDMAYPGSAAKILMRAEEISSSNQDTAGLLLKRNAAFERLRLLGRMFSEERIKLVTQALEGAE